MARLTKAFRRNAGISKHADRSHAKPKTARNRAPPGAFSSVNLRDRETSAAHDESPVSFPAPVASRPPWIPFQPEDCVVLVGEGDFGFARSLVDQQLAAVIIATGLDEDPRSKYECTADANLAVLEEYEDAHVLFGVDVHRLSTYKLLKRWLPEKFTVMFNFPHLGKSITDVDRNIHEHQQLLLAFYRQTAKLSGATHLALSVFEGEPYDSWNAKQLAKSCGWRLVRSGKFPWQFYESYHHQLTRKADARTSKEQSQRPARSYLFERADLREETP